MDPITAAFNFAAKLCDLLATPQGQFLMADLRAMNQDFAKHMSDLFERAHEVLKK